MGLESCQVLRQTSSYRREREGRGLRSRGLRLHTMQVSQGLGNTNGESSSKSHPAAFVACFTGMCQLHSVTEGDLAVGSVASVQTW